MHAEAVHWHRARRYSSRLTRIATTLPVYVRAEAVPWDRVDAQVDLQEDLALVRVSAEALGVPLDDVDVAICAADGNWRAAMQVGLQAAPRRHLTAQGSAQLGRGSAAVCCSAGGRV